MTYRQYKNLSETDQELVLWVKGVMIASKKDNSFKYELYQVDGFYVEVQYSFPFYIISQITSFDSMLLLDPYLQQVNIDSLY